MTHSVPRGLAPPPRPPEVDGVAGQEARAIAEKVSLRARRPRATAIAQIGLALALVSIDGALSLPGSPTAVALPAEVGLWIRIPLGLVTLFFLPGFTLALFLLPRFSDLDGLERVALAVGLSLAHYPLLAVGLDHLPWGLSPTAVIASVMLLTWLWGLAALVRIALLARDELFTAWRLPFSVVTLSPLERLAGLAGLALLGVVAWAIWTLIAQPPLPPLTEFFMLGPDGLAQNYARAALSNQPISVALAVRNLEGQPVEYSVTAKHDDAVVGGIPPFRLEAGESRSDINLTFALPDYGFGQRVDVLLFRSGLDEPYRRLSLVIDVARPGVPTPVRVERTPQPTVVRGDPTAVNPVVPTPIRVIRPAGP